MVKSKLGIGFYCIFLGIIAAIALFIFIVYTNLQYGKVYFESFKWYYYLLMPVGLYAFYLALQTPYSVELSGRVLTVKSVFKNYNFDFNIESDIQVYEEKEFSKLGTFHRLVIHDPRSSTVSITEFSLRNYRSFRDEINRFQEILVR